VLTLTGHAGGLFKATDEEPSGTVHVLQFTGGGKFSILDTAGAAQIPRARSP